MHKRKRNEIKKEEIIQIKCKVWNFFFLSNKIKKKAVELVNWLRYFDNLEINMK